MKGVLVVLAQWRGGHAELVGWREVLENVAPVLQASHRIPSTAFQVASL
jgi:hypothetical protein